MYHGGCRMKTATAAHEGRREYRIKARVRSGCMGRKSLSSCCAHPFPTEISSQITVGQACPPSRTEFFDAEKREYDS